MPGTIDGVAIAEMTIGGLVMWSGLKGATLSDTVRSVLAGKAPSEGGQTIGSPTFSVSQQGTSNAPVNQTTAIDSAIGAASGGTNVPGAVTTIKNYGLTQLVASTYGWAGGQEFAALTNVINRESGGDPNAMNGSGAYGIAQALGHGTANTAGTVTNEYGGFGVPDSTCQAANSGSASAQLIWMMAYISQKWHDPIGAWNAEKSMGSY
jgi:hypothetical protein